MTHPTKINSAQILFKCAVEMGLEPKWLSRQLFTIPTPHGDELVLNSRSSLNSHRSVGLTANKYLLRTILNEYNLPNIPYIGPQTQAEARAFLSQHKRIVAKPRKGSGSYGVRIITSRKDLVGLKVKRYILEKYIQGKELRYLTLNGKVIAMYHSDYGDSVDVGRDLTTTAYPRSEWDQQLVALSEKIVAIINLQFGAVDYLIDQDGKAYVLEVNSAPDLKWFHAPSSGPAVNVGQQFLEAMLAA